MKLYAPTFYPASYTKGSSRERQRKFTPEQVLAIHALAAVLVVGRSACRNQGDILLRVINLKPKIGDVFVQGLPQF
jgi:hypothetical protein